MSNSITLCKIAELLRSKEKIVLFSHTSPDGDTVGSVTALAMALESIGKQVICLCDGPVPDYLSFVCGDLYLPDTDEDADLYVSVDVASPQMLGKLAQKYADRIDLRIDHHAYGTDFAKINYCDPTAAAAAEIITELVVQMGLLTDKIAAPLYVGLSTDTGSFRFSSTTSRTLRTAATLLDAGAPAEDINDRLYENMSLETLRANAFFIDNIMLLSEGKILLIPVSEEKRMEAGLSEDSLEGFSSLARKISGVQLGISLRQKTEGVYKVSMRSRKSVNCANLCALLGGGGHTRAAGATIQADSFEAAKEILLSTVTENVRFDFEAESESEGADPS